LVANVIDLSTVGFVIGSTATVGGVVATAVQVNSSTSLVATTPSASAATVDVVVTTPGGRSATSMVDQFTFLIPPSVTGISPASGPLAGGTAVTVTGTGFTSAGGVLTVTFGGRAGSSVVLSSTTALTVVCPAGAAIGPVDVVVTTGGGSSTTSPADQFTYQ
jgi:hypothetical protein